MSVYREAVLARDDFKCVYCGREANAVDHIIPTRRGGTNDLWNMAAACKFCNSNKHAKHWRMWYCRWHDYDPVRETLVEDRLQYPNYNEMVDERAASTIIRMMLDVYVLRKNCYMARTIERDEYMRDSVIDKFGSIEEFFRNPEFFTEFTQTGIAHVEIPEPWRGEVLSCYNGLEHGFPVCYNTTEKDIKAVQRVFAKYARVKGYVQIFDAPKTEINICYFEEMDYLFFETRGAILDYIRRVNNAMEKW